MTVLYDKLRRVSIDVRYHFFTGDTFNLSDWYYVSCAGSDHRNRFKTCVPKLTFKAQAVDGWRCSV